MSKPYKRKLKKQRCINHRQLVYDQLLDKALAGETNPEYMHERFKRLKEIKRA